MNYSVKLKIINHLKRIAKFVLKYDINDERNIWIQRHEFILNLRKQGVSVGEGTIIYDPVSTVIDTHNPFLLKIGKYVSITTGCVILTHDSSWRVMLGFDGIIPGNIAPTVIGDNVFIGMHSIILRGVTIGDNVIIGAGSVVSKDCESNSVYAGNPAKRICSIEDAHKRMSKRIVESAKLVAVTYYKNTGKMPTEDVLYLYSYIFKKRNEALPVKLNEFIDIFYYKQKCLDAWANSKPIFNGFDEFLCYCGIPKK